MAAYDVVVGACDEDDGLVARKPDAVHGNDVVDLVADGRDRPDVPEVLGMLPERPRVLHELCLGELPDKPPDKGLEPSGRGVVSPGLQAAAREASPFLLS